MVNLDEETIDVIKKIKDVLKDTTFDINGFEVVETGAGGMAVRIDIRRHDKISSETTEQVDYN